MAISLEKKCVLKMFGTYQKEMSLVEKYLIKGLSMLQLDGKNWKARVLCSTADWTGNLMGFSLFEEREGREGEDVTETAGMNKQFWHLSLGKIKLQTFPHFCLHLQNARKVAQMSSFLNKHFQING